MLCVVFTTVTFVSAGEAVLVTAVLSNMLFFLGAGENGRSLTLIVLFIVVFSFSPLDGSVVTGASSHFLDVNRSKNDNEGALCFRV